jgi:hypothetical protein
MMGLKKLTSLIRDLQYEWSFEVRDVDVQKAFGWVWEKVGGKQ